MTKLSYRPGHAPGWFWIRDIPRTLNPYEQLRPAPNGCTVNGLCESGWHDDCRQAEWTPDHTPQNCPGDHPRRCCCPCHTDPAQGVLF